MQTLRANFLVMVPHFLNTRLHNLPGLPVSVGDGLMTIMVQDCCLEL